MDTSRNSVSSNQKRVRLQNPRALGKSEITLNSTIPCSIDACELRCDNAFSVVITRKKCVKNIRCATITNRKVPNSMIMKKKVTAVDNAVSYIEEKNIFSVGGDAYAPNEVE